MSQKPAIEKQHFQNDRISSIPDRTERLKERKMSLFGAVWREDPKDDDLKYLKRGKNPCFVTTG